MQIIAALFIDDIELRSVAGPSTRIDLTGIQFSAIATEPFPCTVAPHLVVIVHRASHEKAEAALEVCFYARSGATAPGDGPPGAQVARNVQLVTVEPDRFAYRLVRAELPFDGPGVVEAHCRLDLADPVIVPFSLLPAPQTQADDSPDTEHGSGDASPS